MSAPLCRERPWAGLLYYCEADKDFFKGRSDECAELTRLIENEPVVVLYGVSGLGKTSLLQAGIFPSIREHEFFPILPDFDHSPDAPRYADQLRTTIARAATKHGHRWPEALPSDTLWETFHHQKAQLRTVAFSPLTPLLVLDQFEEFFTCASARIPARERFFHELADLLAVRPPEEFKQRCDAGSTKPALFHLDAVPLRVVITLREDFLAHLAALRALFPALRRAEMRLHPLARAKAREVICIIGEKFELIENDYADAVLDFVAAEQAATAGKDAAEHAQNGDQPLEPALLSAVLTELHDTVLVPARGTTANRRLSANDVRKGGDTILAGYCERAFASLPDQGAATVSRIWIEENLVTPPPENHRATRTIGEAQADGVSVFWLRKLENARLLRFEDRTEGPRRVELIHDRLCTPLAVSRDERRKCAEDQKRDEDQKRLAAELEDQRKRAEAELLLRQRAQRIAKIAWTCAGVAIAFAIWAGYEHWHSGKLGLGAAAAEVKQKDAEKAAKIAGDELVETLKKEQTAQIAANKNEALIDTSHAEIFEATIRSRDLTPAIALNRLARTYYEGNPANIDGSERKLRVGCLDLRDGYLHINSGEPKQGIELINRGSAAVGKKDPALPIARQIQIAGDLLWAGSALLELNVFDQAELVLNQALQWVEAIPLSDQKRVAQRKADILFAQARLLTYQATPRPIRFTLPGQKEQPRPAKTAAHAKALQMVDEALKLRASVTPKASDAKEVFLNLPLLTLRAFLLAIMEDLGELQETFDKVNRIEEIPELFSNAQTGRSDFLRMSIFENEIYQLTSIGEPLEGGSKTEVDTLNAHRTRDPHDFKLIMLEVEMHRELAENALRWTEGEKNEIIAERLKGAETHLDSLRHILAEMPAETKAYVWTQAHEQWIASLEAFVNKHRTLAASHPADLSSSAATATEVNEVSDFATDFLVRIGPSKNAQREADAYAPQVARYFDHYDKPRDFVRQKIEADLQLVQKIECTETAPPVVTQIEPTQFRVVSQNHYVLILRRSGKTKHRDVVTEMVIIKTGDGWRVTSIFQH